MANKKNAKGRYLRKVGFLDIYAKDTYGKVDTKKRKRIVKTPPVTNTEIVIYHGKSKIEGGFKNLESAIEACKTLL